MFREQPTIIRFVESAEVTWTIWKNPRSERWIAKCDALGIATEAEHFDDLWDMINESTVLLFNDLARAGDLDAFLRQRGWQPATPIPVNARRVIVDLPRRLERVQSFDTPPAVHQ